MSQLLSVREVTTTNTSALSFDRGLDHGITNTAVGNPIETVVQVIYRSDGCGIVLAGEYGVGKTHVLHEAIKHVSEDRHVVSLRCSSSLAHVKFGALSPLLGDVSESYLENPYLVMRTVTKLVLAAAIGKPVVLFIDNVQNLDDESALVIAQLAVNRTVSLVLACNSLAQTPNEIIGLWRDGMIRRLDLLPLSKKESQVWLEKILGGRVARAAVRALWQVGRGNPRYMSALVQEQIEAGTLLEIDGVWVVTGAELVYGNSCIDAVMTAIDALCAEERLVAELLALSGGMALNHLMGICNPGAVDALQQRGYLQISQTEKVAVQLVTPLMEEVLRLSVPVGRSRELRRWIMEEAEDTFTSGISGFRLASWTIECGMGIDPEQVLSAAREATDSGYPNLGLSILNTQTNSLNTPAVRIAQARALMAMGEHLRAETILGGSVLASDDLDLATWVKARLLRSSLSRVRPQNNVDVRALLAQVAVRLVDATIVNDIQDPLGDSPELSDELALVTAQQSLYEGKYLEPAASLEQLHQAAHLPRIRYMAGLGLIEVKALTGKVQVAATLAAELKNFGDTNTNRIPLQGGPLTMAVSASILAELMGHSFGSSAPGSFVSARVAAYDELADGMASVFGGHPEAALHRLVPAATQLEQLGESAAALMGYSAAAYAYAIKGDDEAALVCLSKAEIKTTASSRLMNTVCSYFRVLASAELVSREKALVSLFALADEERRLGCNSVELAFVAAAVRMGATSAARRMIELADGIQGPMGAIYAGYGRGLCVQDTEQLLVMAEMAMTQNDVLLSRDIARAALSIARMKTDKAAMRQAQQTIRAGVAKLGKVKVTAEDGQVLTSREQEIAVQAAGGASNKSIAAKMHISVRTVEGHLYQIYSKMQVRSRAELKETIS